MATGGRDVVVDSRVTCSICLEPFKGRHPKLLQCFHTFCLPCLTQLADRPTPKSLKTSDGEPSEEKDIHATSSVSIVCPTCRRSTPLPSGGVERLQNNFYLNAGNNENDPLPILCDLCEEGQEAKYNCTQCVSYFCTRCTRSHNRFCQAFAVKELTAITSSSKTPANAPRDECQLLQDVIHKLVEEEKSLGEERRAREHDVHVRYAALLRHAGEARDVSLGSLREVTQVLGDVIHADLSLAREALSKIKHGTAEDRAASVPLKKVLSDENRRHFEELLNQKEDENMFVYDHDNGNDLLSSLRNFMGTVVTQESNTTQIPERATDSKQASDSGLRSLHTGMRAHLPDVKIKSLAQELQLLAAKVTESEKQISMLHAHNTVLCLDLKTVHEKNGKLTDDLKAVQLSRESAEGKLRDDLVALQRSQTSMGDKNTLLCQENQQLRSDMSTVQAEVNKTSVEVENVKKHLSQEIDRREAAEPKDITSGAPMLQNHSNHATNTKFSKYEEFYVLNKT